MYGTYLRLNITVHDGWRIIIRAAADKFTSQARHDPAHREARHRFYRQMPVYHHQARQFART
jgi:hypothetical protein